MQSGLSSAGKRTTHIAARLNPPGRDCPRTHVPIYNIYRPAEYASSPQAFFYQITPIQYKNASTTRIGDIQRIDNAQKTAGEKRDFFA